MTPADDGAAARRWLVTGRVQGVGFRWYVYRVAQRVGAVGWVANLPDGRVEAVARATQAGLNELDTALRQGPSLAAVRDVEVTTYPHDMTDVKTFEMK